MLDLSDPLPLSSASPPSVPPSRKIVDHPSPAVRLSHTILLSIVQSFIVNALRPHLPYVSLSFRTVYRLSSVHCLGLRRF